MIDGLAALADLYYAEQKIESARHIRALASMYAVDDKEHEQGMQAARKLEEEAMGYRARVNIKGPY